MASIDVEKLIAAVLACPAIWNINERNYDDQNVVDRNWKTVVEEMGIPEGVVKNKWEHLRDQFRIELKKIHVDRSGDAGDNDCSSTWPYFQSLLFLKDQMSSRKTTENFNVKDVSITASNGHDESKTPKEKSYGRMKRTPAHQLIPIENKKLELYRLEVEMNKLKIIKNDQIIAVQNEILAAQKQILAMQEKMYNMMLVEDEEAYNNIEYLLQDN